MTTDLNTISLLTPELILVLSAAWVFVASAFKPSRVIWASFCGIAFALVAIALWRQDTAIWQNSSLLTSATGQALSGPLFVDAFGHVGRWLAVILGVLLLPLAAMATKRALTGEFLGALVLAVAGLMIVSAASDLIVLFLGMELISIPTYVLLFLGRGDRRGAEATAKYFFLSILSSAVFIYGVSFLYGAAGTTNLAEIRQTLAVAPDVAGLTFLPFAIVMIFAGLGFKLAAVPFHFYAPDVYQATTHANAGLLAVLPKAAGVIALARLSVAVSPVAGDLVWKMAILLSIASMTLGNVCALWQRDLRRLLAYSSIAHAGYMLIGLAAGVAAGEAPSGYDGFGAMYLYLLLYCGGSLGAFATLAYLSNNEREVNDMEQLAGLRGRQPLAAGLLAVFMFSLSGIPPLAGFWGKLTLFTSALRQTGVEGEMANWFITLLIVAALNAAIGAGYYLRVIAKMYFGSESEEQRADSAVLQYWPAATAATCGVFVVLCGLLPGRLVAVAQDAGRSLHSSTPSVMITADAVAVEDVALSD